MYIKYHLTNIIRDKIENVHMQKVILMLYLKKYTSHYTTKVKLFKWKQPKYYN